MIIVQSLQSMLDLGFPRKNHNNNKKGLRQCAKLYDFGEAVIVVVPGQ